MAGHLVHELPSPTKLKKRKKRPHAALPYLEVGAFLADLRSRRGVTALALEWGILTAARSQDIRGARSGELFPAPEGGELSDAAFDALIDDMHVAAIRSGSSGYRDPEQNRIATEHGFRSTFRDWAAEVELFRSYIIEHALAHKLKDEVEAAYQRGDLLLKRTYVMERRAQFCNEPSPQLPDIARLLERQAKVVC